MTVVTSADNNILQMEIVWSGRCKTEPEDLKSISVSTS